jgi:hypothetical protein
MPRPAYCLKICLALLALAGAAAAQTSSGNPDVCDGQGRSGEAKNFVVHLKGGSTVSGRSWLCRDPLGNSTAMRLKIDGRTIYPFHTDSIFEEGIKGIPAPGSAAWAFPVAEGRIRVFAARPGRDLEQATALSKDSEPLVRYNLMALEQRVRDNPRAMRLVQNRRRVGLHSGAMAAGGAVLAFIGLVTSVEEVPDENSVSGTRPEFHPNPLFFTGIGVMIGSWFVPYLVTQDNPRQALRLYNAAAADSAAPAGTR